MTSRRDMSFAWSLRRALLGLALLLASALAASAQTLLPLNFFDDLAVSPDGRAMVEADVLSYDADADIVTASGDVILRYEGFTLRAEHVIYRQRTGEVSAEGNIEVFDTKGNRFVADEVEITGNFQQAFVNSLIFTTVDGTMITAAEADFNSEIEIVLDDATYSPCGLCIDSKGRRIGWRVRAPKMIYIRDKGTIELHQPSLELLGVPMAWLPWLSIPDPSQPRLSGFRIPNFDYSQQMGFTVELPYFWAPDDDTDVLFIPRLMSRQGGLFAVEVTHRFKRGVADVKASGVYQLDPTAFAGTVGDGQWRGAIQTTGRFTPYPNWVTGWSYTKFTDAAYLPDYRLSSSKNNINEVYVTHLTRDNFLDLRVQEFNLLGNVTPEQQEQHAKAIPNFRGEHTADLPNNWGQFRVNGTLLGVYRGRDHTGPLNGVPYIFAYRETKFHGTAEASWQKQFVAPGGITVTPFAGVRLDFADYDGGSALLPGDMTLLSATPLAALDVRWPLIAFNNGNSHLFEPIAQIVYRGGDVTLPGITNDNAQSFVLDDTNVFSYNRFSGTDRQETGLRANIGGRYQGNFENGGWAELLVGESFFLHGANSLAIADPTNAGLVTGLGDTASCLVLASRAGFSNVEGNTKLLLDPNPMTPTIRRAEAGARWWNAQRYSAAVQYIYLPANPIVGQIADQHEVATSVGVPIADYWTATGNFAWDIAGNTWLEGGAGLLYDDKYLVFGVNAAVTGPTHTNPNDFRVWASFALRGPGGTFAF
jgi:LPS-assembly protein